MTDIVHTRGDTFQRTFTLANSNAAGDPWTGAMFDEVKFTVRESQVMSATEDTADAQVLTQVTLTDGGIWFDGLDDTLGNIRVEASETTTWPTPTTSARWLYWDLQGTVDDGVTEVYTLDSGRLRVTADVTRAP